MLGPMNEFDQVNSQPVTPPSTGARTGPSGRRETPEDWEQVRRSVAMLRPRAWAMKREEALEVLDVVVRCLRRRTDLPGDQSA